MVTTARFARSALIFIWVVSGIAVPLSLVSMMRRIYLLVGTLLRGKSKTQTRRRDGNETRWSGQTDTGWHINDLYLSGITPQRAYRLSTLAEPRSVLKNLFPAWSKRHQMQGFGAGSAERRVRNPPTDRAQLSPPRPDSRLMAYRPFSAGC